ncbi:MAG: HAD family hydrolase [Halioglobus sp.]|nr:HAD family hydrolase [Halioglobus sp.]|tara:strand:- start:551 stop:1189 length:639 start_codon:yes stop_codon:yes gene_type:complete
MRYPYLLFDHDGVLVDTEYWYYEATRRALAPLGITLDRQAYQQIMVQGRAAWELAEQAGIDERRIAAQRRLRNSWYQEFLRTRDIEIDGVRELLGRLATRHRMAVVTTARRVDFELIHRERDLLATMEFVLTREDYRQAKPHPEPYLLALQRLGARPEQALVIEDSERGLRAAVAAGIDCAVVHNDFTAGHDFSTASYRLQTLAGLADILRS